MMIRYTKLVVARHVDCAADRVLSASGAGSRRRRRAGTPAGPTPAAMASPRRHAEPLPPAAVARRPWHAASRVRAAAPAATSALEAVPATPQSAAAPCRTRGSARARSTARSRSRPARRFRSTCERPSPPTPATSKIASPPRLRQPVAVGGVEALPAGTRLLGHVTAATAPRGSKGRARVASGSPRSICRVTEAARRSARRRSSGLHRRPRRRMRRRLAAARQAARCIGAILGGGDGAAKGAAIGGAGGTGVVLATRGKEVRVRRART